MNGLTVGIICAMDKEMDYYFSTFEKTKQRKIMNYTFYETSYQTNNIIFTKCGIGKVNAASLTTLLIEHYKVQLIINTGVAGGYDQSLKTLDVVSADKVFYHDVDCCFDNEVRFGQVQGLPFSYLANILLNDKLAKLDCNLKIGSIATADRFIKDYDEIKKHIDTYFSDQHILAFDMESASIAQICYLNQTEFLIIRAISDIVGSDQIIDYNFRFLLHLYYEPY